jgi:hypothetical protein
MIDRQQSGFQRENAAERGKGNPRRIVNEVARGNGRPMSGGITSKRVQDNRGRPMTAPDQNRRGRGGAPSLRGRNRQGEEPAGGRGPSKWRGGSSDRGGGGGRGGGRGSSRGGSRGGSFRGPMNNNRQERDASQGFANSAKRGGRDRTNDKSATTRRVTETSRGRGSGRARAPFRGNNGRNERPPRERNIGRNDKKPFSRNGQRPKRTPKEASEKKKLGPAPNLTDDCKHKLTFYLPANGRYLRAWVDPGSESQTPKRNDAGHVKVAFRSSDAEMLQAEQGIIVTNEKWTEISPSGRKIELVRASLPPNIRSIYEFQQSGEPVPAARKVKKASFVVDPSLVVA